MAVLALEPVIRTDVGRRPNNEDAAFASERLAAVADGVGGHAAGEVASRAIIDALIHLDKCRLQRRLEDALQDRGRPERRRAISADERRRLAHLSVP